MVVIEGEKKCVNFSKSLTYELKQMVNCPIRLIGKKVLLQYPKSIVFLQYWLV